MCSSEEKAATGIDKETISGSPPAKAVAKINGRPVLQPTCNRTAVVPSPASLVTNTKKLSLSLSAPTNHSHNSSQLPAPLPSSFTPLPRVVSPPTLSNPELPSSNSHFPNNKDTTNQNRRGGPPTSLLDRKKSKSFNGRTGSSIVVESWYPSSFIPECPGSIAALRREQMALQQAQRKMRIAHYGRCKSAKFDARVVPLDSSPLPTTQEDRRCSFITVNSDPLYIAYHDQEWGVPVHDDKVLFELLVLSSAQVGSDWTSILRKRQDFRNAFSGFEAEIVDNFTERQILSVNTKYGIDITRVRGVVDNSHRVLEIKRQFGSFDKYIWGFVDHKPICTRYKWGHKVPVKTSKSESISKDMVRRGFRFVGPTVVHSFMQAAGLTNDHLITCHRHLQCARLAADTDQGAVTGKE